MVSIFSIFAPYRYPFEYLLKIPFRRLSDLTWIRLGCMIALVSEDGCLACSACACMLCVVLQRCTLPQDSWSAAKPGFDAHLIILLCSISRVLIKLVQSCTELATMHDCDCRNSSVPPLLRLLAYLTCDTHKVRVQYRGGCYACLLFHKQEHCSEATAPGLVSRLPSYLLIHRHCLPAQGSFIHRPGCGVYKKLARCPDHPKNHTPAHKDWQPRRVPPPQTLNPVSYTHLTLPTT